MKENKNEKIDYRATKDDVRKLNELAEKQNTDKSNFLRDVVNKLYEAEMKKGKKT